MKHTGWDLHGAEVVSAIVAVRADEIVAKACAGQLQRPGQELMERVHGREEQER